MKLHLLAVGDKMPDWVGRGYREYVQRLPAHLQPQLREVAAAPRGKNTDINKAMAMEADRLLAAVPAQATVVSLNVQGAPWSTEKLARQLADWQMAGSPVALLVGGPDGLDQRCLDRSQQQWSLGPLTLPHPLVRVILAEQIYRAWSILQGHPYHRA